MSIKLVVFDMDGLLLNDNYSVTAYTKSVMQKLINKDVEIVLCTGRSISYCYQYIEELNLNSYIVVANAAQIWYVSKKLLDQYLMVTYLIESIWDHGHVNNFFMMLASANLKQINFSKAQLLVG
ncbi:HAD family hydrolase [Oceanobacillus alkalisoli]|uniref:HAD family hydrolase n=1 Tax=Oceanobacillus alkalisoli TaxID=2925113 RepID=UPI001F1199CD|nr:HAD family hydrolase [Oceanobacillus alkalisoli]MCF3944102.1 Cof-type HAD-IIB family hydrolase [Oceanobacillus alkalisoli]